MRPSAQFFFWSAVTSAGVSCTSAGRAGSASRFFFSAASACSTGSESAGVGSGACGRISSAVMGGARVEKLTRSMYSHRAATAVTPTMR